jgi:hypothetical protein
VGDGSTAYIEPHFYTPIFEDDLVDNGYEDESHQSLREALGHRIS